jgi:hypothetical protein
MATTTKNIQIQTNSVGSQATSSRKSAVAVEAALGSHLAANPPIIPVLETPDHGVESKTIQGLEKAYSIGMSVFMLQLVAQMGGWVAGKVARIGGKSAEGRVKSFFRAPLQAIEKTQIGNLGEFRKNHLESAEHIIRKSGNNERADMLLAKLEKQEAKLTANAKKVKPTTAPPKWLESLDGVLGKPLRSFANWRAGLTHNKAHVHMNNALGIPNHGGMFGYFQKPGNGPVNVKLHNCDAATLKKLGELKNNPAQIDEVIKELNSYARRQLTVANNGGKAGFAIKAKQAYEEASAITGSLGEAKFYLNNSKDYSKAAKSSVGKIVKSLPKAAGKLSIFNALIAGGIAAGVTASWMTSNRENRIGKHALKEMAADIYDVNPKDVTKSMLHGENAHPLMQEASKIYKKQSRGRYLSSAANTLSDVVLYATLRDFGGAVSGTSLASAAKGSTGFMNEGFIATVPAMAAQIWLPKLAEMIVPENQTLNAYAVLKQAENGGQPLDRLQRVFLVAQLLAAVPAVANHGGNRNAMLPLVANEIVDMQLSASETVKLIADPERFVELTNNVIARHEETKKTAGKKQEHMVSTESTNTKNSAVAAAPATRISVANLTHDGKVESASKRQIS